ncbi:hypothetical protein M408DRAFT_334124, partial [Serendipita vermifera MAFF 305830]
MADFYPSIVPVPLESLPSNEVLLKVMVPLLEESESWPLGKVVTDTKRNVNVQTFSRKKTPKDAAMWHGRVSDHPKDTVGGFEPFWNGVGVDHTINEKEYIYEVNRCKPLKLYSDDREIWMVHYALSPPTSHRQFTFLITTHLETNSETGLRTGYVMSIPVDTSSDPELKQQEYTATKGAYSAIERVKEMPDESVNWRMITTSTPGGWVPQFLAELSIPGQIAKDVSHFLAWLEKNPTGMRADKLVRMGLES